MSRPVGFSTGTLYPNDPDLSIQSCLELGADAIEVSALRLRELGPVARTMGNPLLDQFRWVSIHAPSRFAPDEEAEVARQFRSLAGHRHAVIVHPDTIVRPEAWQPLGNLLVLENMDRRKTVGRYASEFVSLFQMLPRARLCLDLAHVRQIDPSLVEAYRFVKEFGERLVELHISEVSAASRHAPLSLHSESHLQEFIRFLPPSTPVIIEAPLTEAERVRELNEVRRLFGLTSERVGGHP